MKYLLIQNRILQFVFKKEYDFDIKSLFLLLGVSVHHFFLWRFLSMVDFKYAFKR